MPDTQERSALLTGGLVENLHSGRGWEAALHAGRDVTSSHSSRGGETC